MQQPALPVTEAPGQPGVGEAAPAPGGNTLTLAPSLHRPAVAGLAGGITLRPRGPARPEGEAFRVLAVPPEVGVFSLR